MECGDSGLLDYSEGGGGGGGGPPDFPGFLGLGGRGGGGGARGGVGWGAGGVWEHFRLVNDEPQLLGQLGGERGDLLLRVLLEQLERRLQVRDPCARLADLRRQHRLGRRRGLAQALHLLGGGVELRAEERAVSGTTVGGSALRVLHSFARREMYGRSP